jgi:SH3-like domain-containing protein
MQPMRRSLIAAAALAVSLSFSAGAQTERKPPYWASISAGKAAMRTGPGRNYPIVWIYVRKDLPIRVVETYPNWRKVQDPDGVKGWMLQRLLSDARSGIVKGTAPAEMREKPDEGSRLLFRADPGVVGSLSKCTGQWCLFDVGGRQGYVREDRLTGVEPGESFD